MNITNKQYWQDAILFVVAVALYAPSLRNGFVGDDVIYFIGNQLIKSFDVTTILLSGAIGADYLPLRDLSFAFDYMLWGEDPFGFHLTNVVLFGITVICVKYLFTGLNSLLSGTKVENTDTQAFLAALVFAVHPNHREVVYAVFNRGALLTVFFSILACLSFLSFLRGRNGRYRSYAAALLCYVFALLSREYSIILPMVLVLLIYFGDRSRRTAHLLHTIPFFFIAAVFFIFFRNIAIAGNFIAPSSEPFLAEIISKTAVAAKIALFYIVRMVTSLGEFSFNDSPEFALVSIAIVAGLVFAAFIKRHTYPHALVGLLFYLICLVPVLNFFKTLPVASPRYSFLPCVGLFFTLMAVPFEGMKKIVPSLCVFLVLTWSMMTIYKTLYWKDNILFWELMAARDRTPYAYMQLGYAYHTKGKFEMTLDALRKAQPPPEDPKYHAVVGNACFNMKDYECAIPALEKAMNLGAPDTSLPLSLAKAYEAIGDRVSAERYFDISRRSLHRMEESVK